MRWFRNKIEQLYDRIIAASDAVRTSVVYKRYPYGVPIHIVGVVEYGIHYEWIAENVKDHTNTVWAIFDTKADLSNYPPAVVTHYVGEFRFKRKSDAVNYWLRFN